jgi:hypothetical protein
MSQSPREYEVTYYGGNSQLPVQIDGWLYLYLFDQVNKIIFKPKSKDGFYIYIKSNEIKGCKIVSKNEASLKKAVITTGLLRTTENRYLQLDYSFRSKEESLILDAGKAVDEINTTISLMANGHAQKSPVIDEPEKEPTVEPIPTPEFKELAPKMASKPCSACMKNDYSFYLKSENLCQACFENKFGRVLLKSDIASYYGGHKAFLAGGVFSKEELGRMYLTEHSLIFAKKENDPSKRWQIEIPLKSIDISSYGIEEKARRQQASGLGTAFTPGTFGGTGFIYESGKEHHLVVGYTDENGVPQAPRFGVTSFRGKAIREWAATLYSQIIKVKESEKATVQTTSATISSNSEGTQKTETTQTKESPLLILKMRLAKGEITKQEYEELRNMLEG